MPRLGKKFLSLQFMAAAAAKNGALCHQMIMGAGKTTTVGPLLALLLGDGQSLVTQGWPFFPWGLLSLFLPAPVVPRALLEFSRYMMRERFCSLVRKPVFTFKFDRFRTVTRSLLFKLATAKETRAVVVTTPTDIKAFMLKFIEMMHVRDQTKGLWPQSFSDPNWNSLCFFFQGMKKYHFLL